MLSWKEKVGILLFSITVNLMLIYLYGRFIKPEIDAAAKGIAIMMLNR